MDKYVLRYLPLFYEDLDECLTYIEDRLKNPQAAVELLDEVEKAILDRQPFAESFEVYPSSWSREFPYYAIYVKNFIIFYVVIDHHIMEVRRFLYNHRDKGNLLK